MITLRTFSAKLWLLLSVLTCAVALGSAWSVYAVASASQMARLKQKLTTLATTISTFVDGDKLATLQSPDQHGNATWKEIAAVLLKFQNNDPEIRYVYTMAKLPDTDQRGIVQFIVDPSPEEDENGNGILDPSEQAARLGQHYEARQIAPALLAGFEYPTCDDDLTMDQWGASLSGYAPIHDSTGQVIGIVGVDVMADQLAALRRHFIQQCWIVVFAVIITSLIISTIVSWYINKPVKALYEGITKVQDGNLDVRVTVATRDEFQRLANAFNDMIIGMKEREFIRGTLDKYMSKEVADVVLRKGDAFFNTAERKRLTVLFCDLRGMTTLSEQMAPEESVRILSSYLNSMIEAVFKHGGIVDKLLGDGLMAVFGAPLEIPNHEEAAISCGLDMIAAMAEVQRQTGIADLATGVGINTGSMIVGNIGSGRILDYTVIGDAVNVASRLEHETRSQDVNILISQATAEPVRNLFDLKLVGPIPIRGRTEPVIVYSVEGRRTAKTEGTAT